MLLSNKLNMYNIILIYIIILFNLIVFLKSMTKFRVNILGKPGRLLKKTEDLLVFESNLLAAILMCLIGLLASIVFAWLAIDSFTSNYFAAGFASIFMSLIGLLFVILSNQKTWRFDRRLKVVILQTTGLLTRRTSVMMVDFDDTEILFKKNQHHQKGKVIFEYSITIKFDRKNVVYLLSAVDEQYVREMYETLNRFIDHQYDTQPQEDFL